MHSNSWRPKRLHNFSRVSSCVGELLQVQQPLDLGTDRVWPQALGEVEADFNCCFTAICNSMHVASAPRYQKVCLQHLLNMGASWVTRSDSSNTDIHTWKAEKLRFAGCFSLYQTSSLGGLCCLGLPGLSTQQPSPAVLHGALLRPNHVLLHQCRLVLLNA